MPAPADPRRPEFFVYHLAAERIPFYVGIGRSARASDRLRFVEYLMKREAGGKPVRWCLSTAVVAELLRAGLNIEVAYPLKNVPRAEALKREIDDIQRLSAKGHMLANIHHNPCRPSSAGEVVEAVLSRLTSPRTRAVVPGRIHQP